MDRLSFSISLLFLSVFFQIGNAQTNSASKKNTLPEEIVKITSSEDLVVSGSDLFYQILVTTNKKHSLSRISQTVEVGLYNSTGERILIQKIILDKGVGNGELFINSSLPSGKYYLIAATNWSMNNKEHTPFAEKDIIILNPFQNLDLNTSNDAIKINYKSKDLSVHSEDKYTRSDILVKTDKKTYGLRQKVQMTIESNIPFQTPFTISVKKVKPIEIIKTQDGHEIEISSNQFFVPEIRGSIIQGSISSKDEKLNAANQIIAISIPGKQYVFKIARTDDKGQFIFNLDKSEYKDEDLNIYVIDANDEDFQVELSEPVLNYINLKKKSLNLYVDERLKSWIEFKSTANQIENAYTETKADSVISTPDKDHFYSPLGFAYNLDEYTRFPTVNETFVEIIDKAALRKEGNNYVFKTHSYREEENIAGINGLHPLVLIDGIMINDNSVLVNYEAEKIETITVVPDNYRYGSKIFAGIIDVTTIEGNYGKNTNLKNYDYLYPNLKLSYYQPKYSQNQKLSHIPDYRTQLFWDYNVNLNDKTTLKNEFYTSDIKGWYEIDIKGYNDQGEKIDVTTYFMVE
ncbi:TonB-dependent receptor [Autumnicola musiva]|uniref:Uncharacterized protein n=1 Tax=Autumnicola musiva TaxID=3075589 RepID=A0ABU3DB58_9FLAO|nr:hypothetical protein [Zunongwangia sp. F117]MDT0678758.1 hypothetical protein [Zunongwangia sp. F117]